MIKFLLWCILLVLCWPLALLALIVYPLVWLLLIPFRLLGIVVTGGLNLIWAIVTFPALCANGRNHEPDRFTRTMSANTRWCLAIRAKSVWPHPAVASLIISSASVPTFRIAIT